MLPERFLQEDALFRADVLKDWVGYLVDLYRETIRSDLMHVFAGIQTEVVRKIIEGREGSTPPLRMLPTEVLRCSLATLVFV